MYSLIVFGMRQRAVDFSSIREEMITIPSIRWKHIKELDRLFFVLNITNMVETEDLTERRRAYHAILVLLEKNGGYSKADRFSPSPNLYFFTTFQSRIIQEGLR